MIFRNLNKFQSVIQVFRVSTTFFLWIFFWVLINHKGAQVFSLSCLSSNCFFLLSTINYPQLQNIKSNMKKYEKLYVRSRQETTRDWCRKWREVVTRSSRQRRALTQKEKGTDTYTQTQYSHASERRTSLCRLCGNATKTLRESTHNGLPMRPLRVNRGFRTKK